MIRERSGLTLDSGLSSDGGRASDAGSEPDASSSGAAAAGLCHASPIPFDAIVGTPEGERRIEQYEVRVDVVYGYPKRDSDGEVGDPSAAEVAAFAEANGLVLEREPTEEERTDQCLYKFRFDTCPQSLRELEARIEQVNTADPRFGLGYMRETREAAFFPALIVAFEQDFGEDRARALFDELGARANRSVPAWNWWIVSHDERFSLGLSNAIFRASPRVLWSTPNSIACGDARRD
jgi:hypothetical protein